MSTTSSEADSVGGFLRPFLSYNKDAFCRATLSAAHPLFSPPSLSLSLSFALILPLSSALSFSSPVSFCPLSSFLFLLTYRRIVLPLSFLFNKCLFLPSAIFFFFFYFFFFSSSASSSSFSPCPPLRLYFELFTCVSLSCPAISLLPPPAPLVVLPCILFPFIQFRPSSLACSLSFSLCLSPSCVPAVLSLPPDCPSSVSFFSLRALFLSPPRPIARSAGIRGIFEPVHDGRLLQGRTFLQHTPKSFERTGSIREMKFVRGSREGRPLH